MPIKTKLLVIFSFFALGVPCLVMLVVGWQMRQTGIDNYAESSRAQMDRANNYIEMFFSTAQHSARLIADMPEVRQSLGKLPGYVGTKQKVMPSRDTMTPTALAADVRLEQIVKSHPLYFGVGVGLADGGFILAPSSERPVGYDPRTRDWYKTALEASGEQSYGKLYRAATGGTPVCTAMARIRDNDGKVIGASYININLDTMTRMISAIRLGETGRVLLVEDTGVIITAEQFKDSAFKNINDGVIPGLEDILNLEPGSYTRDVAGIPRIVTIVKGFSNWRFVCLMNLSEVHKASDNIILKLVAVTLF
jgi:methyl-accepting chemotaxis protein